MSISCSPSSCPDPPFALSQLLFLASPLVMLVPEEGAFFFVGAGVDCWAMSGPAEMAQARTRLSEHFTTDAAEQVEKTWKKAKGDLIWTI